MRLIKFFFGWDFFMNNLSQFCFTSFWVETSNENRFQGRVENYLISFKLISIISLQFGNITWSCSVFSYIKKSIYALRNVFNFTFMLAAWRPRSRIEIEQWAFIASALYCHEVKFILEAKHAACDLPLNNLAVMKTVMTSKNCLPKHRGDFLRT